MTEDDDRMAAGDYRGVRFTDVDMSEATFREVDLTRARLIGVVLRDAEIDADIRGLTVNGVQVAPLVEAELNRRYPQRAGLRATSLAGLREAWSALESMWRLTTIRALKRPEPDLVRRVGDEWSFLETLRHLVFVTDAWFGHALGGQALGGQALGGRERPFHSLGLPASFITNGAEFGIDVAAQPSVAEVLRVRAERQAQVREFLEQVGEAELAQVRQPNPALGWPPPAPRSPLTCLHVIFMDEWEHHQFAVRDLSVIEAQA